MKSITNLINEHYGNSRSTRYGAGGEPMDWDDYDDGDHDDSKRKRLSKSERENKYNRYIERVANDLIQDEDEKFLKDILIYIADNGKIRDRVTSEKTKQRQQGIIDLCKEIKSKMKW